MRNQSRRYHPAGVLLVGLGSDGLHQVFGILGSHRLGVQRGHFAVETQHGRREAGKMQVARAFFNHQVEQVGHFKFCHVFLLIFAELKPCAQDRFFRRAQLCARLFCADGFSRRFFYIVYCSTSLEVVMPSRICLMPSCLMVTMPSFMACSLMNCVGLRSFTRDWMAGETSSSSKMPTRPL